MICLPEEFVRGTIARESERGAVWIAELPALVEELLASWDCAPDGEVMHGGVGIVVPVLRKATEPAVLKASFPHPGKCYESDAFAAWGGRGAVLLHERDDERFAMLLERAHTTTLARTGTGDDVARIAGQISRRLAIPAPPPFPACRTRPTPGRDNYASTRGDAPRAGTEDRGRRARHHPRPGT